jgi:hypothetical protein
MQRLAQFETPQIKAWFRSRQTYWCGGVLAK